MDTTATDTYHKINDIVAADTRLERPDELVNPLFTQPFTTVKHLN